jgi:hypothetical protein
VDVLVASGSYAHLIDGLPVDQVQLKADKATDEIIDYMVGKR